MLLSTLWLTYAVVTSYDLRTLFAKSGTGAMSFWLAVDLMAVMPISWVPLVADYFVLNRRCYDLAELYCVGGSYWYRSGINWWAVAV